MKYTFEAKLTADSPADALASLVELIKKMPEFEGGKPNGDISKVWLTNGWIEPSAALIYEPGKTGYKELFSGDYSRDMWGLINAIPPADEQAKDALYLVCCRIQEMETQLKILLSKTAKPTA